MIATDVLDEHRIDRLTRESELTVLRTTLAKKTHQLELALETKRRTALRLRDQNALYAEKLANLHDEYALLYRGPLVALGSLFQAILAGERIERPRLHSALLMLEKALGADGVHHTLRDRRNELLEGEGD